MAETIRVSTDELRAAVGKYNTLKDQLRTSYLEMSNAVRSVDVSWNGDASEAFKAQFDALYRNIETTEARMQDAIDEMTRTAELYDEVEQTAKQTFANLNVGTSAFDVM